MQSIFKLIIWFNFLKFFPKFARYLSIKLSHSFSFLRRFWKGASRFQRFFIYNLSIGILFSIVSMPFQNSVWFVDIDNLFMDNMYPL